MTPKQDEPREKHSKPNFFQSILRNVQATVIIIGSVTQTIIYISIGSLNEKHRRFILTFLLVGSIALIVAGFKSLFIDRLIDNKARLLLIVGCSLFAIICSYYAFFWNPPNSPRRKVIWKLFAAVGMVGIPLLTVVGVCLWMNAPTNPIVTLANYSVHEEDSNASRVGDYKLSTYNKLVDGTKLQGEKNLEIQQINKAFNEDKEAMAEAKDRRATISIWGQYVTNDPNKKDQVKVTTLIDLLKRPPVIFIPEKAKDKEQYKQANEQYEQAKEPYKQNKYLEDVSEDVIKPSKVSIKVTDNTDQKLAYYTNFVAGLAYYEFGLAHCAQEKIEMSREAKENFETSLKRLKKANELLNDIQENKSELSKFLNKQTLDFLMSVTNFYLGNTNLYITYCSKQSKNYNLAIDSFTKAIKSISEYAAISDNRQSSYVVEYPYKLTLASYIPRGEYPWSFDDSNDNQEISCGNKRQDENALASNSPKGFKILLSRVYYNRGIAYAMKGDSENALADFKKAIQRDSETNEFCIGLASAYTELGYYDSAINIYENVIGKTNFAIRIYERAIGKTPDIETSLAYNNLVNTYLRRGDEKQASKKYKKAIGLDSNIFDAYNNEKRAKFFEKYDNEERAKFFEKLKNNLVENLRRYFPFQTNEKKEKGKGGIPSTPPNSPPVRPWRIPI